ncbi:MAG: hypothetical protein ACYS0E_02615 [Planctomycetota bacterium]|jgi:hypothetical protein
MRDEELGRFLRETGREAAPEIPLDKLLDRAMAGRNRATLLAAAGVTVLVGLALGLPEEAQEPPVHLQLHVVEVDSSLGNRAPSPTAPEEFDRP